MDQEMINPDNELSNIKPQKTKLWKPLIMLFAFIAILITGLTIFLFLSPKNTHAQVESLINLYFKVDHVRTDSAKIFAEFMEIERYPERVGNEIQEVGEKPYLSTRDELLEEVSANREEVQNVISIIQSEEFSSEEVKKAHIQLEEYYMKLFEFEDKVIKDLEQIQTKKEFGTFVSDIFEDENYLPAVLEKDAKLREALVVLAEENNVRFANISYIDEYKERLTELDTTKVDLERLGQVKKQFSIPENFSQANVSVAIESGADITDLVFGLRRESTGKVINFIISEIPPRLDAATTININNLPQRDTSENITANIIPNESNPLYLNNFVNSNSKIDYGEWWLMFTLLPDDPILSPVHGDWTLFVLAPAGVNLTIGASYLTK